MCDLIPHPHLSQKYHCRLALTDASRPMEEVDEQGARDATTSKDQGSWSTVELYWENAAMESVKTIWIKAMLLDRHLFIT